MYGRIDPNYASDRDMSAIDNYVFFVLLYNVLISLLIFINLCMFYVFLDHPEGSLWLPVPLEC